MSVTIIQMTGLLEMLLGIALFILGLFNPAAHGGHDLSGGLVIGVFLTAFGYGLMALYRWAAMIYLPDGRMSRRHRHLCDHRDGARTVADRLPRDNLD